jgi:hypothetical protein
LKIIAVVSKCNKALLRFAEGLWLSIVRKVATNQFLEQLVPVDPADLAAGGIVVCDIGRILSQKIANDLVDGIVTFFGQGIEYAPQNLAHTFLIVSGDCKFDGAFRHGVDLLCEVMIIIARFRCCVKGYLVKIL